MRVHFSEKITKMQYLLKCNEDSSYCIVFEHSLIMRKKSESINVGDQVCFLYPEDSRKAQIWEGKVIAFSDEKTYLFPRNYPNIYMNVGNLNTARLIHFSAAYNLVYKRINITISQRKKLENVCINLTNKLKKNCRRFKSY